jgi:1-acyl-sn-glycerol-3-phosphate acyltransferase
MVGSEFTEKSLDFLAKYLRLEVFGTENIPPQGKMICIANHSGFSGIDAIMLAHEIKKIRGKKPKILAHKLWFKAKILSPIQEQFGLLRADFNSSLRALNSDEALILFPEGEDGNFKPTRRRYRLQEFKGGFVRAGLITGAPIIPCVIVGAEESSINLGRLRFLKKFIGTDIPLPLNLVPFPIKWKIIFLPPVYIEGLEIEALSRTRVKQESKAFRHLLQKTLVEALRQRKSLQIGKVSFSDDDIP